MPKNSEKFIFLLVVVAVAFFARIIYPSVMIGPQEATADQSLEAPTPTSTPLLVLPPISAINSTNLVGSGAAQTSNISTSTLAQPTNSYFTRVGNTPAPSFTNQSYMIADLSTGAELSGSNISARWPTASLTKLMTATVVLDNIATDTEITITPQMFSVDPNEVTLRVGNTYTVEDLLHLMLMPSSNVAAEAMADYFGHDKFMAEMNQRAQEWGMQNTYFDDTSGISAANESSASDLLILAQHVYNNYPEILAITNTPKYTITEIGSGKQATIASINVYAGESVFLGGKTGNTPQAGGNLLSLFTYQNKPLFIVVLGAPALPFQDTSNLFTWFRTNFK